MVVVVVVFFSVVDASNYFLFYSFPSFETMNILCKTMEEILFFLLAQKEQKVKITASFKLYDAVASMFPIIISSLQCNFFRRWNLLSARELFFYSHESVNDGIKNWKNLAKTSLFRWRIMKSSASLGLQVFAIVKSKTHSLPKMKNRKTRRRKKKIALNLISHPDIPCSTIRK